MIEIRNLHAGYGREEVLCGIDLTVEKGHIHTIIGCNGSGKSTLLKALLGFLPARGGDVSIDGKLLKDLTRDALARTAAYLPQGEDVPDMTVGRMVLCGRFPYLSYPRKYSPSDYEIARQAMEQMGIEALAEKPLAALSGGMRQKVYIAMALAQQAPVIVMDEPTTYLDIGQQFRFAALVRELAQGGKTVVLVLHDILLALKISDRISVLHEGRILMTGTPEEIAASGVVRKLYGVDVGTIPTENGNRYFYESN